MVPIVLTAALALSFPAASALSRQDAASLTVSAPATLTTLDARNMKGEPTRLAWSPDGSQLFIETHVRKGGVLSNPRYYLFSRKDQELTSATDAPAWVSEYWSWKSYPSAPGLASFKIELNERDDRVSATASPMGGDLARGVPSGGTGTTVTDANTAVLQSQVQHVITLRLKGEVVGQYVNAQWVPGYTFGWAPESLGPYIAYGDKDGHLALMDRDGHRRQVPGTDDVLLPAWSQEGSQIAFFRKTGKNTYDLSVVDVKK